MRRVQLLVSGAVLAGVFAGAIGSVAIPQTASAPPIVTAPAPSVTPAASAVRRVGVALRPPQGLGFGRLRAVGPVRVGVSVADPRGGPAWAVRQFLAERLAPDEPGRRGGSRVVGHNRCVQLGRVYRGRFGWLTADGTFRPVDVAYRGAPIQCLSRRPDMGGKPFAEAVTTITEPRRATAAPVQTVVYGLTGSAAIEPRLRVGGGAATLRRGPAGTLLAVLPASTHSSDVQLAVRYPHRGAVTILPRRDPADHFPAALRNQIQQPSPGAATVLSAQAPDPDGGLPFGMTTTKASDGGFCVSTGGRVVADRVGGVDYDLDLLRELGGARGGSCPATRATLRGQHLPDGRSLPPFALTSSSGGLGVEPGDDPRAGRVARRTLPGRVVYSGTTEPDVRTLTLATPSDVRTIAPSGTAHAFIIVYPGGFPTGDTIVTTTFDDGHTRRDVLPNMGI